MLLPEYDEDLQEDFEAEQLPSKDYMLDTETETVHGYVEELEAVKQAVYFILGTEKYEHEIYTEDYGFEIRDLFGEPMEYVQPEVERRITEALLEDDRIDSVEEFEFDIPARGKLHVTFKVVTNIGASFEAESEVDF